jgi:sialidase-1
MAVLAVCATMVLQGVSATSLASPRGVAADGAALTTWVPTGSFASSSFERIPREPDGDAPEPAPTTLRLTAVRNAPSSAQLGVLAHTDLRDLRVDVVQARPRAGQRPLPPGAVTVRYPAYIPVEGTDEVTADPLRDGPVDVPAGSNQPVWLTITPPATLPAGTYVAGLRVSAKAQHPLVHELVVDVADVTVPDPEDYDFYLNLWLQPDAIAYAHQVPLYSEDHWRLLDVYLADMASRGQKVINAAIIEDPWEIRWPDGTWRAQTYYPFHSLVDWRYDGTSWDFDYTVFDRYVEASLRAGIGPDIRVYALLMFGGRERLYYTDTRTGEKVREVVQLGDARWRQAWSAFLTDFERHLRERGWFEHTMLAFDERPASTMAAVRDFLAESAPAFADKIHIAVYSMDVDLTIPDISFAHGLLPELTPELLSERRKAGYRTTFYTTGGPLTPNTITATPPIGARLLPWIPVQKGLDGYLRWSYNSWPADPFTDPAYRYAQGDEYIVYPGDDGPMSSIRWETFRDGVVDHELLRQLARRAGEDNPVYRRALAMVDTNAGPSPELYAAVLDARAMVVAELERYKDVDVDTAVEPSAIVAGDRTSVELTVRNDGSRPLIDVEVRLDGDDRWTVETVEGGQARRLGPGEALRTRFLVTTTRSTPTGVHELTGTMALRRSGRPVSLDVPVPLGVRAAVGLDSVTAQPTELAAGEPTTVRIDLANRRSEVASARVTVTTPDGWVVEPAGQDVELDPHGATTVTATVCPTTASAGRHELVVGVEVDGQVVERERVSVLYDEAPVEDVTIHSVSSAELVGEDGAAENLIDRDPLTLWHSRWFDEVAGPPHEVVLDLGHERVIHALTYLPRQTGSMNGTVKDYEVYVGDDPGNWGEAVAVGAFAGGRDEKRVDFPATKGRYLRFVILSEQAGQPFASGAELTPLGSRSSP